MVYYPSTKMQAAVLKSKQQTENEMQLVFSLEKQPKLSIETLKIDENKIGEKQVINLSDDDSDEDGLGRLEWHYVDPYGDIQGPFSIISLKRWSDAAYFPPGFMVWKAGQSQDSAVLLSDILRWVFP